MYFFLYSGIVRLRGCLSRLYSMSVNHGMENEIEYTSLQAYDRNIPF